MYLIRLTEHWFFVKLLIIIFFLSTRTSVNSKKECPIENTGNVIWPSTLETLCKPSEPISVNNNFEVARKSCSANEIWNVNPTCNYIQDSIKPCPDGWGQRDNVCIFIVNTTYPPNCPYAETISYEYYKDYVDNNTLPIWLPVERENGSYGEGLFYWKDQSEHVYKNYYDKDYSYQESILNKNCMIFNKGYTEAVSCSETYSAICAYTVLTEKSTSLCAQIFDSSCKQSDYSTKSTCFCKKKETDSDVKKIELLIPYQNLLYTSLDEVCYIGLEKKDDLYIWSNSNVSINYSFWSPNAKFGKEYSFGAISSDGWLLKSNESEEKCTLIEKSPPEVDAQIYVSKLLTEDTTLIAIPRNEKYWKQNSLSVPMIMCFTDTYNVSIIKKIDTTRTVINETLAFQFSLSNNGPGNYWCEGFLYPSLKPIMSNVYYEKSKSAEFVAIISTSYSQDENPLTKKFLQNKYNLLINNIEIIQKDLNVSKFYPRIYKIAEINETDLKVNLNVHLTTKANLSPLVVYHSLRNALNSLQDFTLIDFLSITLCVGNQISTEDGTFTWTQTEIGNVVLRPRETWCIGEDGSVITRSCGGNFIDGASWSNKETNCHLEENVNLNLILKNLIKLKNPKSYLTLVSEIITKRSGEFQPADVDLIVQYISRLVIDKTDLDIKTFAILLEGIMNLDKQLLKQSQENYNSTDLILNIVPEILRTSNFKESIITESFSIIPISIDDFYSNSIFWIITQNGSTVEYKNVTETEVQLNNYNFDFDSGLIFDRNLLDRIISVDNNRIIILAYFKSVLFIGKYFQNTHTSAIFSTIFPKMPNIEIHDLDNLIIIVFNQTNIQNGANMCNCSYWIKDTDKYGHWYYHSQSKLIDSKILCNFKHFTNIGLVHWRNITKTLKELESHNESCQSKLIKILNLLEQNFADFTAIDVLLVIQILTKCSDEKKMDDISSIFDKIVDLPPEVLRNVEVQLQLNLLSKFGDIFSHGQIGTEINKKNFIISVTKPIINDELRFYVECTNNCKIIIGTPQQSYEIKLTMSFESTEPDLDKVIFILFLNKALFITQESNAGIESSKIVGVIVKPDYTSSIVTVDYNTEYDDHKTCEMWRTDHWDKNDPVEPRGTNIYRCHFWSLGYYSLRYILNVTALIEQVVDENLDTLTTLKHLNEITDSYKNKFESIDVHLVATYLYNIVDANNYILEQCANIITNIMSIDSIVLEKSERIYSSASKLIQSLDKISQITPPTTICTSKLLIIIYQFKQKDISGIIINNNEDLCKFGYVTNQVVRNDKYALVLDQDFIKDLKKITHDDPVLIFTVYNDNALFIEKGNKSNTSIIFGLQIPNYDLLLPKQILVYYTGQVINSSFPGCLSWNERIEEDFGFWELNRRANNDLTCSYISQGYFTLWLADVDSFNITGILEAVNSSYDFPEKKLQRLDSISTFYENFEAVDVYLLISTVCNMRKVLEIPLVYLLQPIVINYFKIPTVVKQKSEVQFKATRIIVNYLSQYSLRTTSNMILELGNYFQSIRCDIEKSKNEIFISKDNITCFDGVSHEPYVEMTYFSELLNSLPASVSVFNNVDLFVDNQKSTTSKIIGIFLLNSSVINLIQVKFKKNDDYLPKYTCGYWEFTDEIGKWTYFPTEETSSETICTISDLKQIHYIALVEQNFTKLLADIFSSSQSFSEMISATLDLIRVFQNQIEPENVEQIYQILQTGKSFKEVDLYVMAGIVSELMNVKKEILAKAQEDFKTTENLLSCIDNCVLQFEGEVTILNNSNFAIVINHHSNISGLLFEQSKNLSYNIKEIMYNGEFSNTDIYEPALIIDDTEKSEIYITLYFNNALFNGLYDHIIYHKGIIARISERKTLRYYFKNYNNQTNVCAYWKTEYWETKTADPCENRQEFKYFALLEEYNVTSNLQDILNSSLPLDYKLEELVGIVQNNTEKLAAFDIFLISEILSNIRDKSNTTKKQVELTSLIMSSLFKVKRDILEQSQHQYGATDSLLFTTDEVITKCVEDIKDPMIYKNLTIVKTNIKDNNITGLVLNNCTDGICNISYLDIQNVSQIIGNTNFTTAVIFSTDLLKQINENDGTVYLILTIYFHDNFFNENPSRNMDTTKILGILLEGLDQNLKGHIYLLYNIDNIDNIDLYSKKNCAFWKYQVTSTRIEGFWQNDISPTSQSSFMICEYDHLTHFVLLLADSDSIIDELDSQILDIITNINSVLSLLGLFGILLTTVLFDRWRNNTGNQILINFSVAVSIKNVMLYISEGIYTEDDKSMACTITGGILHYSILSEFCWMLIIAILQFKRFVEVLGGPLKYVLLKACICGWVFPALPVFLIIIIDINNYNRSNIGLCYPSSFGLYLGVWLPLIIIISINLVIFIFILYNVFHKKTEYRDQVNHEILFQWRLAILLFSMLGLTWTFGFLCLIFKSSLFAILFCFLATLQGFIMFLFFIVFNKNTRYLYVQCFSSRMYSKGYKNRLN